MGVARKNGRADPLDFDCKIQDGVDRETELQQPQPRDGRNNAHGHNEDIMFERATLMHVKDDWVNKRKRTIHLVANRLDTIHLWVLTPHAS